MSGSQSLRGQLSMRRWCGLFGWVDKPPSLDKLNQLWFYDSHRVRYTSLQDRLCYERHYSIPQFTILSHYGCSARNNITYYFMLVFKKIASYQQEISTQTSPKRKIIGTSSMLLFCFLWLERFMSLLPFIFWSSHLMGLNESSCLIVF